MEEENYYGDLDDNYNEDWDVEREDMTGCCEDAPHACNHCSNYGCNAHPCN